MVDEKGPTMADIAIENELQVLVDAKAQLANVLRASFERESALRKEIAFVRKEMARLHAENAALRERSVVASE
jgi:hypothetical protein